MTRDRLSSMGVRLRFGGAVLAGALFCAVPPLGAQTTDCGAPKTKGDGADIQCHIDSILAKHQALIGTMKEKLARCAGKNCEVMQKHLAKVEASQQRAKGQTGRYKADDYENVNHTRKAKCKSAQCVQDPAALDVGNEVETGVGADLVDQLDEIGDGLDRTNELLQADSAAGPSAQAALRAAAVSSWNALYDYKKPADEPDYPAWLHVGDNAQALIPTAFAMTVAATVASGIEAIADNVCHQLIFGTNASVACAALSVVVVALEGTARLLNYNLSDATAWDAHGAYKRLEDLDDNLKIVDGSVASVGVKVGGAQAAVAEIEKKAGALEVRLASMRQRLVAAETQIIQLLLTPEGRRAVPASLLTCDGSAGALCPTAALNCSPTTGLCTFK